MLSDLGYGGLKLAEVCNRLGVTTGSFYHCFPGWPAYTRELVGLGLPHGAEAAIRVWSSVDSEVYSVQAAVDRQRFDIMFESAFAILQNKRQAQLLDALDSGRFASVPDGD